MSRHRKRYFLTINHDYSDSLEIELCFFPLLFRLGIPRMGSVRHTGSNVKPAVYDATIISPPTNSLTIQQLKVRDLPCGSLPSCEKGAVIEPYDGSGRSGGELERMFT
eukprot:8527185-Pyramimonas_sp.AAC.1